MQFPPPLRASCRTSQVGEFIEVRSSRDALRTAAALDHRELTRTLRLALWGVLATIWQQDWQYQPNVATMHFVHGGIVTGLNPTALSVATTCFQYHEYGRRAGLKIRSP